MKAWSLRKPGELKSVGDMSLDKGGSARPLSEPAETPQTDAGVVQPLSPMGRRGSGQLGPRSTQLGQAPTASFPRGAGARGEGLPCRCLYSSQSSLTHRPWDPRGVLWLPS